MSVPRPRSSSEIAEELAKTPEQRFISTHLLNYPHRMLYLSKFYMQLDGLYHKLHDINDNKFRSLADTYVSVAESNRRHAGSTEGFEQKKHEYLEHLVNTKSLSGAEIQSVQNALTKTFPLSKVIVFAKHAVDRVING